MRKSFVVVALLAASHAPLAAQPAGLETVSVELSNFMFSPRELTLEHGRTYRLHLVNTVGGPHDFSAPEFFAASAIAPADRGVVTDGKVRLAGKHTVDITLTPQASGSYKLTCTHFMHSSFGMRGLITVR
jgi:uncharacterized cupredoxin-like copper-binding protein